MSTIASGQTAGSPTATNADLTELNKRLREEASLYKTVAAVSIGLVGVTAVGMLVQRFLLKQEIGTAQLACYARQQGGYPQPTYGAYPQGYGANYYPYGR